MKIRNMILVLFAGLALALSGCHDEATPVVKSPTFRVTLFAMDGTRLRVWETTSWPSTYSFTDIDGRYVRLSESSHYLVEQLP